MKSIDLQRCIIYGPVMSRRLGRSLGINLLPVTFKMCTMNCCYCQYGWTTKMTATAEGYEEFFPSFKAVTYILEKVFNGLLDFDYLTFSGNGEPTLHPEFPQIIERLIELRTSVKSNAGIAVLSNGTTCSVPEIRRALEKVELPIMKLDAGNERTFRKINHTAPGITFNRVVTGIRNLNHCILQTMFVRGAVDNSSDYEVDSWIEAVQELQPEWIQIYSLDRPAANPKLQKVDVTRLGQIAKKAESITGVKVDIFD